MENYKNINLDNININEIYCNEWGDLFKYMAYCLLAFNIMTFFIGKTYLVELLFKFLPLFFSIIFLYLGSYVKNQKIKITLIDLSWLIFFIFILGRIKSLNSSNMVFIFYIVFCLSIIVLYKEKIKLYIMPIKILKYVGIIYAISVFIQAMAPDLFFKYLDFAAIQDNLNFSDIIRAIENTKYVSGIPQDVAYSASYISFSIGALLSFRSKTTISRIINFILIIMLSFALLLTAKRAHILFTVISVGLIYFIMNKNVNIFLFIKKIIFGCVILIILLILYLHIFPEAGIISRFLETYESFVYGDDISSGRLSLYATAWSLFLSNPIVGVGWRQYTIAGNEDLTAHNNYLQILSEAGIIGLMLFVIALFVTWTITFKKIKSIINIKISSDNVSILIYSLYIQTFFILYGLTGSIFYYHGFILIYFFACSMVYYYDE